MRGFMRRRAVLTGGTRDAYRSAYSAGAVLVATEWPEFRLIEAAEFRGVTRADLTVGRNCLSEARSKGSGIRLVGFG